MDGVQLNGVFSIKVPVSDLARSRAWYENTLGFSVDVEFPDDDGVVRGLAGHLVGVDETFVALRTDPAMAESLRGANLFNLGVADDEALDRWATHLDERAIARSPKIDATIGWMIVIHDPDDLEIHLYSRAQHGIDQSDRSGYGRSASSPERDN